MSDEELVYVFACPVCQDQLSMVAVPTKPQATQPVVNLALSEESRTHLRDH